MAFTPAKTGFSRVFIIDGRARPDHVPSYESCMKLGAVDQSFGDVEKIECPDPDAYNQFVEIGEIQGAIERASSTLTGRYAADLASVLLAIAKRRCSVDVQVHFGACTDPSDFSTFTKALILEDVRLTNWSTEDLGALGSDENAKVDESSDLSAKEIYETLPLSFAPTCGDVVTNPVIDVVICDSVSCGDCDDESTGCERVFAVTNTTPGSPGTAPDVIWTVDAFANCAADDINSMTSAQDPTGLACVGDVVVVISNDSNSLHYKAKATIWAGTAGGWVVIAAGFEVGGEPNDIWSVGNYAFIVGDGGYVYGTEDPTAGVTVLDAGIAASTEVLTAVHAISDQFAVAVGESDTIVYTTNRTSWQAATATGSTHDLNCVWIIDESTWWVGTNSGALYYTLDGGQTWTLKTLPGAAVAIIHDVAFATRSIGYLVGTTATAGLAMRTFSNGGGQGTTGGWTVLPEGVGTLPANHALYAVAACTEDANYAVMVGLADDDADGIIIVGQD